MSRPSRKVCRPSRPFHPEVRRWWPCSFGYRTRDYAVSGVYATGSAAGSNHFRDRIVATFGRAGRAHNFNAKDEQAVQIFEWNKSWR